MNQVPVEDVLMFDDEDLSAAVLADMRNIFLLLTRTFSKVVLPSDATDEQKLQYRIAIESTFEHLQSSVVQPIMEVHPNLSAKLLTIKSYLEEV